MGARKKTRRRSKIGAMKKQTVGKVLTTGAGVAAGIVVAKLIVNNISILKNNALFGAGVQIVGATVLSGMKGDMFKNAAAGMGATGIVSLLNATAPQVTQSLGIAGISGVGAPYAIDAPSVVTPGIAGRYNGVGITKTANGLLINN